PFCPQPASNNNPVKTGNKKKRMSVSRICCHYTAVSG
ncbi:MAG: hypothetical protein ACI910_001437, partial [Oleispira sp.]